jgi:hypothetical protein
VTGEGRRAHQEDYRPFVTEIERKADSQDAQVKNRNETTSTRGRKLIKSPTRRGGGELDRGAVPEGGERGVGKESGERRAREEEEEGRGRGGAARREEK